MEFPTNEMDATLSREVSIPEDILESLIKTSNSSTLNEALEILIRTSRRGEGRSSLAPKGILRGSELHFSSQSFLLVLLLTMTYFYYLLDYSETFVQESWETRTYLLN
ncbi:hypothetical protein KSS87_010413 [Heliosperma pusillum]|nr:hypothetical protein KSS87_010413 [Heliosperma pusillum]